MKLPPRFDVTPEQANALLGRIKAHELAEGDVELLTSMVETLRYLYEAIEDKKTSIQRLRRILFGDTTEKTKNVLKQLLTTAAGDAEAGPHAPGEGAAPTAEGPPGKRKGHGRNGVAAYPKAERTAIPHATLKPGDSCPSCKKGKVFELSTPGVLVRFVGRAPIMAKIAELQKLRCSSCQEVFTADPPPGTGTEKYDATCVSMVACLKYGLGLPFQRIEALQAGMGVPLPASTQWDLVSPGADSVYPAYEALVQEAAQGQVVHHDDSPMEVLSLRSKEEDPHELDAAEDKKRTGIFTTGIVSKVEDRQIALFFTGHKHAGENLEALLKRRTQELGPPIAMCDALSRNAPREFQVILANCLAHGRRKFVEIAGSFPQECIFVLETLRDVYRHDATAKEQGLSAEERLAFHQLHSAPLMEKLRVWFDAQFDALRVEPNSRLGKAINYMIKHWEPLTLFLHRAGAPVDNNTAERILKKAILHRKNSYYYRTENGARVGDIFMSLIQTCALCEANPFEYLTALLRHVPEVAMKPRDWLPWNYEDTLRALNTS